MNDNNDKFTAEHLILSNRGGGKTIMMRYILSETGNKERVEFISNIIKISITFNEKTCVSLLPSINIGCKDTIA